MACRTDSLSRWAFCGSLAVACGGHTAVSKADPSAGAAGATQVPIDQPWPSPGCNHAAPAGQSLAQYTSYTARVTGRTLDPKFTVPAHDRGYYVWLPADYDATKPYRVTFQFAGCGSRPVTADASTTVFEPINSSSKRVVEIRSRFT